MKTTLEIPDTLFRKAKAEAAARGLTLKQLVNDALREKLTKQKTSAKPAWMKVFGAMKSHSTELRRIDKVIEQEFGQVDPRDWE